MKEKLEVLWAKIVENKDPIIRTGTAVLGSLIGVGLAALLTAEEIVEEEITYETEEDAEQ